MIFYFKSQIIKKYSIVLYYRYGDDNGQETETMIGAFSSKESAIKNAKVTIVIFILFILAQ